MLTLWHHKVHEKVLGETLAYFQLSFVPVYRRKDISNKLLAFFSRNQVHSFCIYEIYGLYDIMIRAWLPKEIGGGAFTKMLQDELRDLGCARALPFLVSDPALHWCWWDQAKKAELDRVHFSVPLMS